MKIREQKNNIGNQGKTRTLRYVGLDSWSRPVYENDGNLFVDVDPRQNRGPSICTKYNNEFDGEPDSPVEGNFEFVPHRITWD